MVVHVSLDAWWRVALGPHGHGSGDGRGQKDALPHRTWYPRVDRPLQALGRGFFASLRSRLTSPPATPAVAWRGILAHATGTEAVALCPYSELLIHGTMRACPRSFDPKGVPHLTVSSRAVGLSGGSRQPSGTNVFGGIDVSVVAGLTTRAVHTGPH